MKEEIEQLGTNVSETLREALEEANAGHRLEELKKKLDEVNTILSKIDVREDREGR